MGTTAVFLHACRAISYCLHNKRLTVIRCCASRTIGGCGAFPSAFRECRNTCGYCSATMQMTVVKYDFRLATSTQRCDIKTYFARTDDEMRKKYSQARKEFDPLARLTWKRPKDTDYFIVEDHNYEDFM
uniref:ShKT domain-containing protein n=1 Tax=Caenorhabditis tropicalis TaxID=1561998 RepID=A0A1I7TZ37_9PELO